MLLRLAVGQDPDIGGDARVVEQLVGQGDDGLQQVVLDDPLPDVALAASRPAGEKRRPVEHDADPGAFLVLLHLRDQVLEEQQGAVADAGQPCPEPAPETLLLVLMPDRLLYLLPLHPERGVGEAIVKEVSRQPIVREGVAELDVGRVLPLDKHVGPADGVGLGVDLLPEHLQPRLRV